jgi:hypothetical protein
MSPIRHGPVASSCTHGNEPLGSTKGREFLDQMRALLHGVNNPPHTLNEVYIKLHGFAREKKRLIVQTTDK